MPSLRPSVPRRFVHFFSTSAGASLPFTCRTSPRPSEILHRKRCQKSTLLLTKLSWRTFYQTVISLKSWQGLEQDITKKVTPGTEYFVSAYVRVHGELHEPVRVQATLKIENDSSSTDYLSIARVLASQESWVKIEGSFDLKNPLRRLVFYLEGPPPGMDLLIDSAIICYKEEDAISADMSSLHMGMLNPSMGAILPQQLDVFTTGMASSKKSLAGCRQKFNMKSVLLSEYLGVAMILKFVLLCGYTNMVVRDMYALPKKARFEYLKEKTDKVRKRDIVLKFEGSNAANLVGSSVRIQQTQNSFPFGSCIARHNIENEDLADFFVKNFNWAVFENELKWYHTEPEQGRLNYKDSDELLEFCEKHKIQMDVTRSLALRGFVEQVADLQERGAPVGGIGVQGHISHPVGEIICDSLDKLAILGLPIWITELDVTAENEHIRADDLEVFLREAFAHPAVGGIVLWGFWEMFMFREHAHLVDADGTINEAGKRYLALKQEWLTRTGGNVDHQGEFKFRGYHGSYTVEVDTPAGKLVRSFVVDKDNPVQAVSLNI
ncbi:hypothetical protein PR202_ga25371 [Eleusine coracana subsp. coracana]|uniref:GH10 domain-containing protein n=1 Tax=Eleusine coracana subsp. coracana TaxID=191504 RepID=A0AAV5DAI8_ELECO|nr:hypothetical protein PR202_ga25371 [Eleusine coracana subsp. coracana]